MQIMVISNNISSLRTIKKNNSSAELTVYNKLEKTLRISSTKEKREKKMRKTNSNATAIKFVLWLSPVKTKNIISNSCKIKMKNVLTHIPSLRLIVRKKHGNSLIK